MRYRALTKKSPSRPSARLDAPTEITEKNRQSHRATESFTPFGHFFGKKNDHKILKKRLVLQHKRRTSAVPGTEKKSSSRPSARLDASTEITKKEPAEPPCYGTFHAAWSFFWRKMTKKSGKGSFCNTNAGPVRFRALKKSPSRPSARLGASTEITKKKNRQSHRATEPFMPFGLFFAKNDQKILKRPVFAI